MNTIFKVILLGVATILVMSTATAQKKEVKVTSFDNVIISPHIEATFIEGSREMVSIDDANLPLEKLNIKVEGNTLKIYLDGAKTYTKSKKVKNDDYNGRQDLYSGTQVSLTITYKHLKDLSVRGEENIRLDSPIEQNSLQLSVYGESDVRIKSVVVENLKVSIYGESFLKIDAGESSYQKYKAYGVSEVNTLGMKNKTAKITAYGESEFRLSVSERLKVNCYGEAEINYKGDPSIDKGVVLGENSIRKI
ncbi:MAG: head GIN domain-containing protein [Flavobacteriaceae bacterium]